MQCRAQKREEGGGEGAGTHSARWWEVFRVRRADLDHVDRLALALAVALVRRSAPAGLCLPRRPRARARSARTVLRSRSPGLRGAVGLALRFMVRALCARAEIRAVGGAGAGGEREVGGRGGGLAGPRCAAAGAAVDDLEVAARADRARGHLCSAPARVVEAREAVAVRDEPEEMKSKHESAPALLSELPGWACDDAHRAVCSSLSGKGTGTARVLLTRQPRPREGQTGERVAASDRCDAIKTEGRHGTTR